MAGLLLSGWIPAQAQNRDWGRAHRIIEQTQEDLHHIAHHDVWASADRGHYEAAERNLSTVRRDLDQNRLDRRRLDAAIGEIEHITHVDALDRRARERLNDDVRELHRLRDSWRW
ncbi:MAG: hypothetical protein ACLQVN_04905 [Bryobacteraceae bacterium]